jgi:hypothetical protein
MNAVLYYAARHKTIAHSGHVDLVSLRPNAVNQIIQ